MSELRKKLTFTRTVGQKTLQQMLYASKYICLYGLQPNASDGPGEHKGIPTIKI
jgi:hypothetical protein